MFFALVVFFATVTHVFCDGWRSPPQPDGRRKSCFLRRFLLLCGSGSSSSSSHRSGVFSVSVVFFATLTHVFCDGWRRPPSGALFSG